VPDGEVEDGSAQVHGEVRVAQLRLAVTAEDYDHALRFYRDVLGMPELGAFTSPSGNGSVTILDAGRATLELADPPYAAYIDEVEVGRRAARSAGGFADHPLCRARRSGLSVVAPLADRGRLHAKDIQPTSDDRDTR
jgi:catechol 2,3-dioxygenase-like lactoylglutathione lyase family enzyme